MTDGRACITTATRRIGALAALAVIVLLVHSAHAHIHPAELGHWSPHPVFAAGSMAAMTVLATDIVMNQSANALEQCMMLEFATPRMPALALALVVLAVVLPYVVSSTSGSAQKPVWIARSPPASRRQAFLGVYLI